MSLLPCVFLDVDGVLNSDPFLRELSKQGVKPWWMKDGSPPGTFIESALVQRLNPLVGKVRFVASTSWRKRFSKEEMTALLQAHGWTGTIDDSAPYRLSSYKCNEIGWYLKDDPRCQAYGYIILDDEDCSYPGQEPFHQIRVNPKTGLTEEDVAEAARRLGVVL